MKPSKRIDYLSPAYEMDLTELDRLPTDTGIALIDRLNAELNAQSERLEDIFIEIACENMDNPRKCAFYKELRKSKKVVESTVSEYDKEDIRMFHSTGRHSKTELQELYGLKLKEINTILGSSLNRWGKGGAWAAENQQVTSELLGQSFDAVEEEDDFDPNNPDYLAILEEVKNNPRD